MQTYLKHRILCFFLCPLWIASATAPLTASENILLNLDVNQTLIATDTAGHKTLENVLSTLLSEKVFFCWSAELDQPMTYRAYIEQYVLPGLPEDSILRKKRAEHLGQFISFLKTTHHPLEKDVVADYELMKAKLEKSFIFPSFLNLIAWLKEQAIPYTIILRTFGTDSVAVATCITQIFSNDSFFASGKFKNEKLFVKTQSQDFCFKNWDEIYHFFKSSPAHLAIQDEYYPWEAHQRQRLFGKRFFIDVEDCSTLSLFFDDKIINDDGEKNIVDPVDVKTLQHMSITKLIEQKKLFSVDTYQAIVDDHYYIDLVKQAINSVD